MRSKLPPQVVRLVLLTIAIVGSYLVARFILTPHSFGELGWYRADALTEAVDRPLVYAGKEACIVCHKDQAAKLAKYQHKTLSCEVCHGPGQAHAEKKDDPDYKPAKLGISHCLRCHETDPSRPKFQKQVNSREHYAGQKCTECHVPHAPSEMP
jgi:hypothetical protein